MNRSHLFLVGLAAAATLGVSSQASADTAGVKVGMLTCNVNSGWGLVFGSSRKLQCTFSPDRTHTDRYVGKISKFGVDIGYTSGGVMVWAVFAPGSVAPGALAGSYGGVTGGASVGVGANANVLVGGSNKQISLQPASIEGATGLNIAAGVASIELSHAP
jgi:hypothetical protein